MKLASKLLVMWCFLGQTIASANLQKACPKLAICAETVSQLTGKKYLITKDLDLKILGTSNLKLAKESADTIFSAILLESGLTRIPVSADTYSIIDTRDIRYYPVPEVAASFSQGPQLPNTSDYYRMSYQFQNAPLKAKMAELATRSLRPLLSRYGRMLSSEWTNQVMVIDSIPNLLKIYSLLKQMDQALSEEQLALITASKVECPAP